MKPEGEEEDLTQEDLDAYKLGREGISDGGFFSDDSSSNIKGQMDKANADAEREEKEESESE